MLTASAAVPKFKWTAFFEQPTAQALTPIRDQLVRVALLIGLGLFVAILAGMVLARRMLIPITALSSGARLLGEGKFGHRIEVKTKDELEELAGQFNSMASQLQETYTDLEWKVKERTRDLAQSINELKVLEMHIDLAARHDQLILVHTPHLEDKLKGTRLTLDALRAHPGIRPERVIIDHVEEHTVRMVLDAGFWAGMTLYPNSKCSSARAIDIIECYGGQRLWMNSACDWGVSVPLAIPYTSLEMRKRGHTAAAIDRMAFGNPVEFLSQSPKFRLGPDVPVA